VRAERYTLKAVPTFETAINVKHPEKALPRLKAWEEWNSPAIQALRLNQQQIETQEEALARRNEITRLTRQVAAEHGVDERAARAVVQAAVAQPPEPGGGADGSGGVRRRRRGGGGTGGGSGGGGGRRRRQAASGGDGGRAQATAAQAAQAAAVRRQRRPKVEPTSRSRGHWDHHKQRRRAREPVRQARQAPDGHRRSFLAPSASPARRWWRRAAVFSPSGRRRSSLPGIRLLHHQAAAWPSRWAGGCLRAIHRTPLWSCPRRRARLPRRPRRRYMPRTGAAAWGPWGSC
jgi:hypothetical protein